jgi:hypothetical protein
VDGSHEGLPDDPEALKAANAELRALLAAKERAHEPTQPTLTMSADMLQQLLGHIGSSAESKDNTPVPKGKTGWAKILGDVEGCLKAGEVPPVLKLSRANRARVQKEMKAAAADRRVILGSGGATLTLPGVDTDTKALPTDRDSQLWSGLSAFFRLFSIMAALPEEDFPRASLSEFMTVWSEIWDSPMGTHAQKLTASVAFYDKYASTLGTGAWLDKLDSDSRFLLEHMKGDNPGPCGQCSGSGESGSSGPGHGPSGSRGGARDSKRGGGKNTPTKRKGAGNGICASMLVQSRTCNGACGRSHSPCPSCGQGCASAKQCAAWDQSAINSKYGDAIKRIEASKRRFGK